MGLYKSLLRPLAFQIDPEKAHHMAMALIQRGNLSYAIDPLTKDPVELLASDFQTA